ncbi:hypothetical protein P3W85_45010 [Cupriavidus basilensis]|uniref:Transmembrane protein n=1 Tax=Cupriavidus basilensis TaxID=68895 RepID=A0ABT6B575_9BURK|nr:hypothetical protein [Cupriavidus basilensis]MDF3840037.1 hypothetical protein [Cupriavidus basilensis]
MMNSVGKQDEDGRPSPLRILLYLAGAAILAAGIAASAFLYMSATSSTGKYLEYAASGSKQYALQLEGVGGRATFLAAEFTRWLEGVWHSRSFAYVVLVLCTAAAFACFLAAHGLGARSFSEQIGDDDDRSA